MTAVKPYLLRQDTKASLVSKLETYKKELASLRVAQVSNGAPSKLAKIKTVRKDIARIMTVISELSRSSLRTFYAGKKYQPLDLRVKKTRAIRRRMTAHERSLKTLKQVKKETHFPMRKYAIKA